MGLFPFAQLYDRGVIHRRAFSVHLGLNDPDAQAHQVLCTRLACLRYL
jgi:hypothetical protein